MEEYSHNLEKNLEDLEMEMEKLNGMINELSRRVSKEKDRGIKTLPKVQEWISMAKETESKASSLLDESISGYHDLYMYDDISKISESTRHYSEMVSMTLKEVKALKSNGDFKVLVERTPLSYVKKVLPLQPIVSRKMLLEKAWKYLMGDECETLSIYGRAGVGKTTLLTQLKNKFTEDGDASRPVIFVFVEPDEEIEGIQLEIGKILGLSMGRKDKEEKASEIFKFLNVKRFVLLLDGIHRKVDLGEIGVPEPTRGDGCKFVFTTRSQETCKFMRVDTEIEVKCLSPEEAWDFFQKIVGETTLKSHPDIPQLARIVAKKCGGLPIALSLIGATMSHKRTVREWHHAIHVFVSSTTEVSSTEDEFLPILKFTYDNLHGESLRSCFLYCALFPKSCDISKQDLVDCWIAEGMIEEEDREIAEIKGYEMIADLVMLRLLIDDESGHGVTMHGMVRKMALWIASDYGRQRDNFVAVGGMGIHKMPEVNDWSNVRRMSVTTTQVTKISDSPDSPELTTLFLQENSIKGISRDFFRWMTSLVVLNISRNGELAKLPEEISSLVSLRLLNLSWTKIKRLPLGLKELKKLIHLDLNYTSSLRKVEVIGDLPNLQVLRVLQSVPMDLSLIEKIELLKSLKELSLTVREVDVLKRLLSIHQLASCIRHLHLTGITINDGGTLLLNSMLSLRELNIGMCNIPAIAVNWRSTIQRERLHFGNIQKIPYLQNIRTVALSWCMGLKDLTWLLLAPNLVDLKLQECQQIKQIINKEKATGDMSDKPFQNLTRLSLDSLPQLESIYWTPLPFPVLKDLCIRGCPKLRRLPFNSSSTKKNQVRSDLDQEWIKGIEWEDDATKQHFSYFYNRDFLKMAEDPKMDDLASESHPNKNISLVETSENTGKSTTVNSMTDFDNRDIPTMSEEQKMDSLASELQPTEEIVLVQTSERGQSSTANSIPDFDDRRVMDETLLSFEVERLSNLLVRETKQFQGVEEQFEGLKNDVEMLRCFLKDAEAKKHASEMVRKTIKDIKEIVFDAEDIIETFLLKKELGESSSNIVKRSAYVAIKRMGLGSDVKIIRKRISEVIRDMQSLGVQKVIVDDRSMQALQVREREMRQTFSRDDEDHLVGMESNVKLVVAYLLEGDSSQVVSITGMGGLGKTTLARQVYNHEKIKSHFPGLAWVCVSQQFERKGVWQTILRQLIRPECDVSKMMEEELQEKIVGVFETQKALIVIDDIWRKEDWDLIKKVFLPKKGWKVLLTSRNEEVALHADKQCVTFKPECLTFEESWDLFQRTAFPIKDTAEFKINETMKEIGKEMIKHCGGLPLALKVLGRMLGEKHALHEWERIYESISSNMAGGFEDVFHVLCLSFEELPVYLKHCFLYLAIFPEDYEISVAKLSFYWAAERIPRPRYYDGASIREVADAYIEELVKRNMVISKRDVDTSRFEKCQLHDMMREVCLRKSEEENFVETIETSTANSESPCKSRRLAVVRPPGETSNVDTEVKNPSLRTLLFINIEELKATSLFFTRHRLMRVLDLSWVRFEGGKVPSSIGKLIHLRYLSLAWSEVTQLPSSMRNLKKLLYLDVSCPSVNVVYMPNIFNEMRELTFLCLPKSLHDETMLELGNLVKLETLKNFSTKHGRVTDLQGMTRLRSLSISITDDRYSIETLSSSLREMRCLESLTIDNYNKFYTPTNDDEEGFVWDFVNLKQLALEIYMPRLPDAQHFPSHLTTISLKLCSLKEDPMPILEKLLHLKEISLHFESFGGRRMDCSRDGFPQLQKLQFWELEELEEWIVEDGSMPLLHTLGIFLCPKLKELPDGLGFITNLEDLSVYVMGDEFNLRLSEGYFPSHLTTISLCQCRFTEDPMPILEKLLYLKDVSLKGESFCGRRMVCSRDGFPQLQKLYFSGLKELEEWIVEEGSMPLLHTLEISNCPKLKELPDGLRFITSLKSLRCYYMEKGWEKRHSEGGEDYYKVRHIPSVDFGNRDSDSG